MRGNNKLVSKTGYTKAIDMWSLGCLATALFSGSSYFVNSQTSSYRQDSSAAVAKASAECDLTRMEIDPTWKDLAPEPKDLIKRLLKLDEHARMTADQALEHEWFTQPSSRKRLIQTAYQKAISTWSTTRPGWDFIEDLTSVIKARTLSRKV